MNEIKNELKWFDVEVTFKDGDKILDAIKGYQEANALINAWHNWEDAKTIRLVVK
jgi:hypothetical protein